MKLRQLREDRGLTQKGLSSILGISPSMISMYESGGSYPSVEVLIRMAHFLQVSTDYLLGMTETNSYDLSALTDEQAVMVTDLIRQFERANAAGKEK